jgi:hypothetical protein
VIPEAVRADLGHLLRWAGKISNDDGLGLPEALDRLYVWLASPKAVPTKEHIAHGLVGLFSIMTWDEVERNPRAKAKWLRKADAVLALLDIRGDLSRWAGSPNDMIQPMVCRCPGGFIVGTTVCAGCENPRMNTIPEAVIEAVKVRIETLQGNVERNPVGLQPSWWQYELDDLQQFLAGNVPETPQ